MRAANLKNFFTKLNYLKNPLYSSVRINPSWKLTYNFSTSKNPIDSQSHLKGNNNSKDKTQNVPPIQNSTENNDDHIRNPKDWDNKINKAQTPVVLDCYATWCEPCRKLAPILEEKYKEAKGAWKLIKLDIDEVPQLATALKLRSVPTVILINKANAIDSFVGYPTDHVLQTFFGTLNKLCKIAYDEEKIKSLYDTAMKTVEEGKYDVAIKHLSEILTQEEWIAKCGANSVAALAYCYIKKGDKTKSQEMLQELKLKYSTDLENEEVKKYVEATGKEFGILETKSREDPKIQELRELIEKEPANLNARYNLANLFFENNLYQEAIDQCLDIIRINRNWENRKANQLILNIFTKLGSTNPLVVSSRKILQKILY